MLVVVEVVYGLVWSQAHVVDVEALCRPFEIEIR